MGHCIRGGEKMKKLIIYFSVILMVFTTCFAGCSKKEEATFDATFIETGAIELYDTVQLSFDGIEQAVITTSDSSVLQVVGTSIFGKKAGTADVTVNYNGEIHKQNVLVKDLGNKPTIEAEDFQLLNGDSLVINPIVTFKGKEWKDAIVTVTSQQNFVEVEGLKVMAKSLGTASLNISVEYMGVKEIITKTINCGVVSNDGIATNHAEFNVYIKDNVDGNLFNKTIEVIGRVFENGVLVEGAQIDWAIEDQAIAQLEGNVITALKTGSTFLTGTYVNGNKTIKTTKLPINVNIPIVDKPIDVVIDLRNEMHPIKAQEIFGEEMEIGGALNEKGFPVVIEDNSVSTANMAKGETEMTFFSADKTYGYKCNVVVGEVVVYNNQDLQAVCEHYDKYIVLDCDLDFNGADFVRTLDGTQSFTGVFNGAGHVIKNIAFRKSPGKDSLFGGITSGTLKNVAFTGVKILEGNCGILAYTATGSFTVDNVYIESSVYDMWAGTIVARVWRNPRVNISNTIIKTTLDPSFKDVSMAERAHIITTHSGIIMGRIAGTINMKNSYFISEDFKLVGQGIHEDNKNYDTVNAMAVHYNSEEDFLNEKNKQESRIDTSSYNHNWDFSGIVPIFKTAK